MELTSNKELLSLTLKNLQPLPATFAKKYFQCIAGKNNNCISNIKKTAGPSAGWYYFKSQRNLMDIRFPVSVRSYNIVYVKINS